MATVALTRNLERHIDADLSEVPAGTVRSVLEAIFAHNSRLRSYILDDQGVLRQHVAIFVDGARIRDRLGLGDPVDEKSVVYVMQALSGG